MKIKKETSDRYSCVFILKRSQLQADRDKKLNDLGI